MNALKRVFQPLLLMLLLTCFAAAGDQGGKDNTETHQNQDGSWTGTTTYRDGSKKVVDEDKDHHTTKETRYDPKGNKTEESEWGWNAGDKTDVMRKQHIYAHKEGDDNICESETEFDENGVKVKERVVCGDHEVVDTYSRGKRKKRDTIVGGKVVKTEHFDDNGKIVKTERFDKDGKPIQQMLAQPQPPNVNTPGPGSGATHAQLIGLVYEKDSRPGEQVTMTLTSDPRKYKDIPALGVIEMQVATPAGGVEASLHGIVVDLGDGRKQPADKPLTVKIAESASAIPVILASQADGAALAEARVPLTQKAAAPEMASTGKAGDFTTPPVVQNTSIVVGPFSGNAGATQITVDSQPASIVAASPRSVVFDLPRNTATGLHTLSLREGSRPTITATIARTGLTMQAGQLQLQKGQSTHYSVTVELGTLPESVWQRGGTSDLLGNTAQISQMPDGWQPPQAGEPGTILLLITNTSPNTVTLKPSHNQSITRMLSSQHFRNGQYTESGMIQSKKSGGFDINATVLTFFAPITLREAPAVEP